MREAGRLIALATTVALILSAACGAQTAAPPPTGAENTPPPPAASAGQDARNAKTPTLETRAASSTSQRTEESARTDRPEPVRPTASKTPTPTDPRPESPTTTPLSAVQREPSDQPGPPENLEETMAAIAALTAEERACLPQEVNGGRTELSLHGIIGQAHAETLEKTANCVTDQSLVNLLLMPQIEAYRTVTEEERNCIASGDIPEMIRLTLPHATSHTTYANIYFITLMATAQRTAQCLGPEALYHQGVTAEDLVAIECLTSTGGGPRTMIEDILKLQGNKSNILEEAAIRCQHADATPEDNTLCPGSETGHKDGTCTQEEADSQGSQESGKAENDR